MYHAIVRRRIRRAFADLSRGAWDESLRNVAEDVHHVFPGDHPIGGERHSRDAAARWFERLGRLFPGHDFEVEHVASHGGPWSTWVAVQWTARLAPQQGEPYLQEGAHWIHVRWGRVDYFHAYVDTQLVASACRYMAERGIEEAAAAPITD